MRSSEHPKSQSGRIHDAGTFRQMTTRCDETRFIGVVRSFSQTSPSPLDFFIGTTSSVNVREGWQIRSCQRLQVN